MDEVARAEALRRRRILCLSGGLLAALLVGAHFLRSTGPSPSPAPTLSPKAPPARIVSLAPSLTETVFALGAGGGLVGVTRQCRHPDAVLALPKVGDYMGPDDEALLMARPDLVLVLEEHAPAFPRLEALGLRYRVFDHRSLAGLERSFDELGALLGHPDEARALRAAFDETRARLAERTAKRAKRPRVLMVIGRDYGADRPRNVYAVGPGNLYAELLDAAGADNAYTGPSSFPQLEEEGLLALRPDLIVELIGMEPGMPGPEATRAVWARVSGLAAAEEGRVRVIGGDYAFVPGPRTLAFLIDLARTIHDDGDDGTGTFLE